MTSTDEILKGKYPAKAHVKRVVKYIESANGSADGMLYLEGQKTHLHEDSDQAEHFRQRRSFFYLTGCDLPDCFVTYDIAKDELVLYIPPVHPDNVIWAGMPLLPDEAMKRYDVDLVKTTDEINHVLTHKDTSKSTVWAIDGRISNHVTFLQFENKNMTLLKEAVDECRVVKDTYEIAMIRKANEVSAKAHIAVMKKVKTAGNEMELEGQFLCQCISNGCRNQAYSPIIASGTAAATLHYVCNDAPIVSSKLNMLLDAGGEYRCYAADITRTFPLNGKFTKESREIYNIVLEMQSSCMKMLREGVSWVSVHMNAHRVAIDGLLKLGILQGDAKEIYNSRVSVAFFPHGLGHYLGMDTHDTGGHANYEDEDSMLRYLRVRRDLPAGSVITVEPGVYFCRYIIEPVLENPKTAQYINKSVLDRYWDVGGVRIEDDVLILKNGCENLTDVPKSIEEMEAIVNS